MGRGEKLPKAVAGAVKTIFPGMTVVKVEKEDEDGDVVYEITLRGKGGTLEAKLTPKGRVVEVELKAEGEKGEDEKKGDGEKGKKKGEAPPAGWTSDFSADKDALTHTGKNPYFVLEPGYQLVFEDDDETVVKTVLDETKVVDGVECRVVEERETKKGKLVEVSRNYFAISKRTNSVYYFGEDVDEYEDGKVVGHKGSWLAGKDGARFGLMMPGVPLLGGRSYQEVAPKVAEDRAEIVALGVSLKTPAGEFKKCVRMEETTPLEPKTKEYKVYAPGVGCVQDGDLKLVKYGKVERPR